MTMLQLAGPPAATAFRLEKLRAELRSLAPTVTDAAVNFEHFVNLERPLTDAEQRVLAALLDYGGGAGNAAERLAASVRRAAARHDLAVGLEGHRHREAVRVAGAAYRARPSHRARRALGPDRGRAASASRRCCTIA